VGGRAWSRRGGLLAGGLRWAVVVRCAPLPRSWNGRLNWPFCRWTCSHRCCAASWAG